MILLISIGFSSSQAGQTRPFRPGSTKKALQNHRFSGENTIHGDAYEAEINLMFIQGSQNHYHYSHIQSLDLCQRFVSGPHSLRTQVENSLWLHCDSLWLTGTPGVHLGNVWLPNQRQIDFIGEYLHCRQPCNRCNRHGSFAKNPKIPLLRVALLQNT